MAKGKNQKEKLFRTFLYLMENTDATHGVSVGDVRDHLLTYGITAERKSIYDDFAALGGLGFPVKKLGSRPERYTLEERVFDPSELKLLVDAIQSSRFISRENSRALIAKLERFAGRYHAAELSRQVYVENRIKTKNSGAMENVDLLHGAIRENAVVNFSYFDYDPHKKKVYRHDGARYCVCPLALIWSEENYYLVGFDIPAGIKKHFRVDKMDQLEKSKENFSKPADLLRFDPATYAERAFSMYGGREELVTLECADRLAGVLIDRFGFDPTFFPQKDGRFRVSLRVMVSPNFYAWILGFGADMKVLSPEWVKSEMRERLLSVIHQYETEDSAK